MKFLSKLGQIILKGVQVWMGFQGVVSAVVPGSQGVVTTISKDLSEIANIIVQAEIFGQALGLPGTQKLQMSAPAVAQIILQSALLSNHKIHDEVLFRQGAQKIADGMADVLNSLKDDIDTSNKG